MLKVDLIAISCLECVSTGLFWFGHANFVVTNKRNPFTRAVILALVTIGLVIAVDQHSCDQVRNWSLILAEYAT